MFEAARSELANRLYDLVERFTKIHDRFRELEDEARLTIRLGIDVSCDVGRFGRLAADAEIQAGICGQIARRLLMERALPIFIRRGVKRAERFASQMEAVIFEQEVCAEIGHAAFQKMMNNEGEYHAPNP